MKLCIAILLLCIVAVTAFDPLCQLGKILDSQKRCVSDEPICEIADLESDRAEWRELRQQSNSSSSSSSDDDKLWDCTNEKLNNGFAHHPVMRRFWCFQGEVAAGVVEMGWLGQMTPTYIACWTDRQIHRKEQKDDKDEKKDESSGGSSGGEASTLFGACGVTSNLAAKTYRNEKTGRWHTPFERQTDLGVLQARRVMTPKPPVADAEYYEMVSLLGAVSRARGSFVMIEAGAGWGRWLMHAHFANQQARKLPTVLVGVEADPIHYSFMRQNFAANDVNPDKHMLLMGGVGVKSGEGKIARLPPASNYGAAFVEHAAYEYTTVPMTSLEDLISNFWVVDHVDFDIQGLEGEVIRASQKSLNQTVRSVWVECHSVELYLTVVQIFREMEWTFLFSLPPTELGFSVDYGQGPVQLDEVHGGVAVLNPFIK